jgi:hypothetical protein
VCVCVYVGMCDAIGVNVCVRVSAPKYVALSFNIGSLICEWYDCHVRVHHFAVQNTRATEQACTKQASANGCNCTPDELLSGKLAGLQFDVHAVRAAIGRAANIEYDTLDRAALARAIYSHDPANAQRAHGWSLSWTGSAYLAAVLEYMSAEMLELSGNNCKAEGRLVISVEDLETSQKKDEELNQVNVLLFGPDRSVRECLASIAPEPAMLANIAQALASKEAFAKKQADDTVKKQRAERTLNLIGILVAVLVALVYVALMHGFDSVVKPYVMSLFRM